MSWLLSLPIVIPVVTAIAAFLLRRIQPTGRWLSIVGCAAHVIAAAALLMAVLRERVLATQMGDWPAPFGITLAADILSAGMVLVTAITGFCIAIYAAADIDERRESLGYHALYQTLLAGVCGAFLTGDLFNLYVWFEVMLIASFTLLVLGGGRAQLDAGIKYVALNLVATLLLLVGIALLYGLTGTLNLADLHIATRGLEDSATLTTVAVVFIAAFGIKAAVFPLFFWLPASYHTPPVAVSAVFAALLTKVGVYALFRLFTLVFTHDVAYTHGLLLLIAVLTMVTGVLGAAAQNEFRKILSFHIVSQIGYMVLGLALLTPLALAGAILFVVHNIASKTGLFLVSGIVRRKTGSFQLARIGGVYKSSPLLAILFLVPAFSLAGMPPLSGFWAKFLLVKASLDAGAFLMAGIALAVGILTLFSMTKIWGEAFWKPHPAGDAPPAQTIEAGEPWTLWLPAALFVSFVLIIGVFPQAFVNMAQSAAGQLLDPTPYVDAVLGGGAP